MDRKSAGLSGIAILLFVLASLAAGFAAGVIWRARGVEAPGGSAAADPGAELYTCGMHPQVIQKGPGTCPICRMKLTPLRQGTAPRAEGGLVIDPVMVQNMGLRTAVATEGPLERTVRAPGWIREAEPAQHDFSLKVSGWVRRLHADTEGMHIAKGTVLMELYSPEVLAAGAELIAARRALESLPAAADPLARIEATRLLEASREKLLLWDIAPEDVDLIAGETRPPRTVLLRSPYEGHLVEKPVVEGSAVEAGQKLFRIVDHTTLWIDAQIYERDLAFVFPGQEARATVSSLPGRTFSGRVLLIHPHLHEVTRSATARIAVENPDLVLRPGMYAAVVFRTRLLDRATLVPREAVIDTGERKIAFMALEGGRFDPREVLTGPETDEGLIQVTEGIRPGERVVTSGQFLLDAESRTREAARKFLAESLARPPGAAGDAAASPAPPPAAERLDAETRARLLPAIDDVARRYLDVASAMAADDEPRTRESSSAFAASASALSRAAEGTAARESAAELSREAAALDGKSLEAARPLFRPVSDRAIRFLEAAPPSAAVAAELSVIHCPMFPGNWLQRGAAVANPYYGKEMLGCGEVVRTIRAEGKAP
jgi:multidrug efflux pump subunit AcrA (membrane-fusion protein)